MVNWFECCESVQNLISADHWFATSPGRYFCYVKAIERMTMFKCIHTRMNVLVIIIEKFIFSMHMCPLVSQP